MCAQRAEPRWIRRLKQMDCEVQDIHVPRSAHLPQDQEWCEVDVNGRRRRIRFHDYDEIYKIPGLYEQLFYVELGCCSPSRVVGLLEEVVEERGSADQPLRVLDVGAGNGMVGEELRGIGARHVVGIDIVAEAKKAAQRDRPEIYDQYLVTDLTDLPEHHEHRLRQMRCNCLTTVAALGFGDIPPAAFLKALDVTETPAWLAFNIKESFLDEQDDSGFAGLVHQLSRDGVIRIEAYRRYQHRESTNGRPLYYVAMVAKKLLDPPDELMDQWENAA